MPAGMGKTSRRAFSSSPTKKAGPAHGRAQRDGKERVYRPRLWTSMGMAVSKFTPYQLALGSAMVARMDSRV